jgi:hypothetical protein
VSADRRYGQRDPGPHRLRAVAELPGDAARRTVLGAQLGAQLKDRPYRLVLRAGEYRRVGFRCVTSDYILVSKVKSLHKIQGGSVQRIRSPVQITAEGEQSMRPALRTSAAMVQLVSVSFTFVPGSEPV